MVEVASKRTASYGFRNGMKGWVSMKRLVVALTVGFLLVSGSTAHAAEKVMYQEITDNKPEVGVSATVYLGDRMLEQRRGSYKDCIVPKFDNRQSGSMGIGWVTVKSGVPVCKQVPSSKYYTANYLNWMDQSNFDFTFVRKKPNLFEICITQMGMKAGCTKGKLETDYETGPWFIYRVNSIQQVIEYAGRNGDNLKFTYSEFSDGYARQAFTREFQVDLTQGKVAAYKGAIIEIESATNSSITYKVVRNFQQ